MRKINKIVIHHTCTDRDKPNQVAMIRHIHKNRGLGSGVQYHYLIHGDGATVQTRAPSKIGNHCFAHNDNSLGIALTGNFQQENPTEAQLEALEAILVKLCTKYQLPSYCIYGHQEIAHPARPTLCPGSNLIIKLQALRGRVNLALHPPPPLPPPPPKLTFWDKVRKFLGGIVFKILRKMEVKNEKINE
jgi:hypothetical protein